MKICTIVGARPQFIKAAALSEHLRNTFHEVLIHTGQHYDYNMSDVFFNQLALPSPDYNLHVSGGGHGKMTGHMMIELEQVLMHEKPDMVLVYGDTNSTMAGALTSVKLRIPICHVEAGVRHKNVYMPEEINRVVTDHVSDLYMCCTEVEVSNLKGEGIIENVFNTGDLMYDSVLKYINLCDESKQNDILDFDSRHVKLPNHFYLLTSHRERIKDKKNHLYEILSAMEELDGPVVYPVHPRNKDIMVQLINDEHFVNTILIQPVSYLTSLYLIKNAKKIITDSGGIQREAWFFKKQCVILNDVGWNVTLVGNICQTCKVEKNQILHKLNLSPDFSKYGDFFGNGRAAEKITANISRFLCGD